MILLGLKDIGQIQGFILAYYSAVVWVVDLFIFSLNNSSILFWIYEAVL